MDPTPNGGRDRFSKWPIFDLPEARDLDLDLGSGKKIHFHEELIGYYRRTKFHEDRTKKNFEVK